MYDLIIIGGGPGGVAAGVYAARKKIKTLLITDTFGGQSLVSNDIQNWIGTKSISGFDLGKSLEEHLRAQADIEIVDSELVTGVVKKDGANTTSGGFTVTTNAGKTFDTKYILLASGSRRRRLGVPGEDQFDGKGVVFCTTCDAPLFGGKTVVVVGGGNSALEGVLDLLMYASKIYLMVRSEVLRGDPTTQEKIRGMTIGDNPKVEILWNSAVEEIKGDKFVTGIQYKNAKTGESKGLTLDGVFVEIGLTPNSDFVKDLIKINEFGRVVTDGKNQQTSQPGIWAAGDVADGLYDQNNISVGDSIKAVLNIYDQLKKA
jgi:NADH-dependent peroxiredoxin subunit F